MSDNTFDNNIDSGEFKLIDILAEFSGSVQVESKEDIIVESESHAISTDESESFPCEEKLDTTQECETLSSKDSTLSGGAFGFSSAFTSEEIVEEIAHSQEQAS